MPAIPRYQDVLAASADEAASGAVAGLWNQPDAPVRPLIDVPILVAVLVCHSRLGSNEDAGGVGGQPSHARDGQGAVAGTPVDASFVVPAERS